MIKKIICLILSVILVLSMSVSVLATAGTSSDPLVTKSYALDWATGIIEGGLSSVETSLQSFYDIALANSLKYLSSGITAESIFLTDGASLSLSTGASLVMIDGTATFAVNSGELVNVTTGVSVADGELLVNNRYIVCENSSVTVTVSGTATFIVDGAYTKTLGSSAFTDVATTDWFYTDVYKAVSLGLVNGMTDTTYEPYGNLTYAQTIKLAACMHELYNTGAVTLTGDGEFWYVDYVDYALENGIIETEPTDYNAYINRAEFVHIFYNSLPTEAFAEINDIADGKIPDVSMGDDYAVEIYTLYRAGILTGYSNSTAYADNAFGASTNIVRSELATIIVRMMDESARKTFSIG